MKLVLGIIAAIVILGVVSAVAVGGYLGFVPGVSNLFGANEPKDLGVTYTDTDYQSYITKSLATTIKDATVNDLPAKISFSNPQPLTASFTQAEISARLAQVQWPLMPLTSPQVRINSDGSLEVSGVVSLTRIKEALAAIPIGFSTEDINKALPYLGFLPEQIPVYGKVNVSVVANQIEVDTQALELGKISLPAGASEADQVLETVVETIISQIPGLNATSVTFENGKMNFAGSAPTEITLPTN